MFEFAMNFLKTAVIWFKSSGVFRPLANSAAILLIVASSM